MKKKFAKIIAFVLAFALCFTGVCYVLDFKYLDSVYKMKMFYKQPENSVDVLVLGSSHAYQGINTAVLWQEYGYTAYDLCGAAQPIWNSYYYLEEALKTQTPKLIIFDAYTIHYSTDYSETSFAIKNTYGLKWSDTKKAAIEASFDTEESGNQYFYSLLQYHSRYSDLNNTDFYPYQANEAMYSNHKGFYCYFYTTDEMEDRDFSNVTYINNPTNKNVEYYEKIIELAQSKNIPILITAIPFAAEDYHEAFFNTAKLIAEDYNVPFYDFLSEYKDELNLDYSTDFSDKQHLNFRGNTKLTRFFGNIIKKDYKNITDKRGNPAYSSWEADSKVYYNQLSNYAVTTKTSLKDYEKVFSEERYKIIMTESGFDMSKMSNQTENVLFDFFDYLKIDRTEYIPGGVWIFENGNIDYYNDCSGNGYSKSVRLSKFNDAYVIPREKTVEDGKNVTANCIFIDGTEVTQLATGLNIYVYDTFTQSTVDVASFNFKNGKFNHKQ